MQRLYRRLPWQSTTEIGAWDEDFHAHLCRSLASILFVVSGLVQILGLLIPSPGGVNQAGVIAVGLVNIAVGFGINRIPAFRFTDNHSTLILIPAAATLVALHNYFNGPSLRNDAIFFIVCYVWLGVARPRGAALRTVPILIVSFLMPSFLQGGMTSAAIGSLVYVVPVCVLVSETLAWMMQRLRTSEAELERRKHSEALVRAESRQRALIEQLPSATYIIQENRDDPFASRFEYVSPQIEHMFGVPPEEWVRNQQSWLRLIHPDDKERVMAVDLASYRTGEPFDQEYRIVRDDGQILWILETARRVESDGTSDYTWLGEYYDITQTREAEASLRETNVRYQTLIEQIPLVTYLETIADDGVNTEFVYISPQIIGLTGYTPEELVRENSWLSYVHPEDLGRLMTQIEHMNRTLEPFAADYRLVTRDDRIVWVHDECVVVYGEDGRPKYWHGFFLDITPIKQVEAALRQSESDFRLLFYKNPQPAWVYDQESLEILEVNERAIEHYGYTREQFSTLSITDLLAEDWCQSDDERPSHPHEATRHQTATGQIIHVEPTAYPLTFHDRPAILMLAQDVTSRHALQAQLAQQAYHDALTGLPNRALFRKRLDGAMEDSHSVGVVFVDLDDFKRINDSLGHSAGDAVLIAVAERLGPCVRAGDTIARLGGDEFTILLEHCTAADAIGVVERFYDALHVPISVNGREVVISPSIGIAVGDETITVPEELLRRADVAMYVAKRTGKSRHVIFAANMDHDAVQRLDLETDLRKAIRNNQLQLYYQPINRIATGEVVGLEALVRWDHPVHGMIPSDTFIPLAEATGLITELGDWVLRLACAELRRWHDLQPNQPSIEISVNISALQFQDPHMVERVQAALTNFAVDPAHLTLEITESLALNDLVDTQEKLRALKAIGLQLAIDDFGTGYSGLGYLQRCQIDTIKIDRSYIRGICENPGDEAMVRAVSAYARTLGVKVVAEGVESQEQIDMLREIGVSLAQGFLYAEPMPAEEVERIYFAPLAKTA